jgi:CBS domain containing-hemolysin-like protein
LLGKNSGKQKANKAALIADREQLRAMLRGKRVPLEESERTLLLNVLEVHDTIVREIMVPRIDMITVNVKEGPGGVIEKAKKFGHSRLPLIGEDQDSVLGIIFARDFLAYDLRSKREKPLIKMCRPALFVPETKRVFDLLEEFQKQRMHMAIVVDEYGGVSGLVSLEDVLELFVGDILDEYDNEKTPFIHTQRNVWNIDARASVHDVNTETNADLPEDQADTIGGLFLELFGSVPKRRETVIWNTCRLRALSIRDNRIIRVQLTFLDTPGRNTSEHELQKK